VRRADIAATTKDLESNQNGCGTNKDNSKTPTSQNGNAILFDELAIKERLYNKIASYRDKTAQSHVSTKYSPC
jgi:hypothetical protein